MELPDPDELRRRTPTPPPDHNPDWREQREIRRVERRKIQSDMPGVNEHLVEVHANEILKMWLPRIEQESFRSRSVALPAGFTPSGPRNLWTEIDVLEFLTDRFNAAGYGTQWSEAASVRDPKPDTTYLDFTVSW